MLPTATAVAAAAVGSSEAGCRTRATGTLRSATSPAPSWPALFEPQQYAERVEAAPERTQNELDGSVPRPAPIPLTGCPTGSSEAPVPTRATAVARRTTVDPISVSVSIPAPSCPEMFVPQQYGAPAWIAHAELAPTATSVTSADTGSADDGAVSTALGTV